MSKKMLSYLLALIMAFNLIAFVSASDATNFKNNETTLERIDQDIELQAEPCPNCRYGGFRIIKSDSYGWTPLDSYHICPKNPKNFDVDRRRIVIHNWRCDNCFYYRTTEEYEYDYDYCIH